MADSPRSDASHDSVDESTGALSNKLPTAKDKKCQYCGQAFTSSSLGRHLDQYLHKKKPDGIHDVDEIRRLRGGITRRTARNSKAHEREDASLTNGSPAPPQASPPVVDTLNGLPAGGLKMQLNAHNWLTTGVITDTSHTNGANPVMSMTSLAPSKRPYSSISVGDTYSSDKDAVRALELALREVLDSLRAATARAAPRPSPFAFDLQSQTFPSLCLTLLPTPPTLFSPSPFATSTSVSLDPPSSIHLELLRLNLSTTIQRWKWNSLRTAQSQTFPTATATSLGDEADHLSLLASQYEDVATKHLDLAYSTWMRHPPDMRQQMWQIELMRALATEKTKSTELEERMERITQEAARLQGQVEYLSKCQWPREMALWPPERVRFTKAESDEIRAVNLVGGTDDGRPATGGDKWDYERLVGKWKKHVREDKSRRTGIAVQNSISGAVPTSTAASTHTPPRPASFDSHNDRVPEAEQKPRLFEANGTSAEHGSDGRRKSMRQQQQQRQQVITGLADQTEELREFT